MPQDPFAHALTFCVASVAQGFDELEVTRAVLDWWTTEGPAHLGEFVEQVVTALAKADAPDQEAKN